FESSSLPHDGHNWSMLPGRHGKGRFDLHLPGRQNPLQFATPLECPSAVTVQWLATGRQAQSPNHPASKDAGPSQCSAPFEEFLRLIASRQPDENDIRIGGPRGGVQDWPVRSRDRSAFARLHRAIPWISSAVLVPEHEPIVRKDFAVPVPRVLSGAAADPLASGADDCRNPPRQRRSGPTIMRPESSAACTE